MLLPRVLGVTIEQVLWSDVEAVSKAAREADLVISTLPAGVADPLAQCLDVRDGQVLLDVVYSPRHTALRAAYEAAAELLLRARICWSIRQEHRFS